MELYVYLNEIWHVDAWTTGGPIPIKPSSSYWSEERDGIYTPDENITYKSNIDAKKYGIGLHASKGGKIAGVRMTGCYNENGLIPDIHIEEYSHSDGLVLCFCADLGEEVARKFKDKKACVKILDVGALKQALDSQLGMRSIADWCKYTSDHQRNHFLKSESDSWQAEYRLFWPSNDAKEVTVLLPPGTAELVATY